MSESTDCGDISVSAGTLGSLPPHPCAGHRDEFYVVFMAPCKVGLSSRWSPYFIAGRRLPETGGLC